MAIPIPPDRSESFDQIALDLRELRETAGAISYGELVRRITERRIERGLPPAAATPARSTVYNAFKMGRTRMDAELLRDIVLSLGASDTEAEQWILRCRNARAQGRAKESTPQEASTPVARRTLSPYAVLLILVGCVAVNLVGLLISNSFRLSVYLDMVGTAIAALAFGPWPGAAVGVASSGLGFLTGDPNTVDFAPVNLVGALVWGYGVRRFRMGATLARFMTLSLTVAFACTAVAVPIVMAVFHGGQGHSSEITVLRLEAMNVPFMVSVFSTNIITSVMDKFLSGFMALGAIVMLTRYTSLSVPDLPLAEKLGSLRVTGPLDATHPLVLRG